MSNARTGATGRARNANQLQETSMTHEISTSEVLNRAADLIEERGWGKGADGWGEGAGLCLEGGILAAIGVPREIRPWFHGRGACPAFDAVSDYLEMTFLEEMPWRWNDARGRTQTEVIEVLRATALIEAARETRTAEVDAR